MKVLQVNNMGFSFGVDQPARDHFRGLLEARPDVEVILLRNAPLPSMPEIEVVALPEAVRALPWFFRSLWRIGQAVRAVRRRKIDFVQGIHLWPAGMVAWAAATLTGRPSGVSIVAGSREIHYLGRFMRPVALFALRRCEVVAVTGSKTKEHLAGYGVDASTIRVIPNATDIDRFHPMEGVEKPYHVVSTNRLFPVKNLEVMLRALARVREEIPDLRAALGGGGPEEAKLRRLADELDLTGAVDFLGWLDDVPRTVNQGRIFALTSRSEGFPISVLEAMACGLPCVVSNVGDMADVAVDGKNAFVIDDCDDVEAFAEAMLRLLKDDDLRRRMGREALAVRETHSYSAVAAAWREIFDRLFPVA
ncbi:MAG: glycosyltransferase family 4 protein [Candidatus Eisenbacteria bacterium]